MQDWFYVHLRVPREELFIVIGDRDLWNPVLNVLPRQPAQDKWKIMVG